jgi:hypothetical protein
VEDNPEVRICLDRILGRRAYQEMHNGDLLHNAVENQLESGSDFSTSNEDGQRRRRVISAGRR